VARRLLDRAFLEHQVFVDAVLQIDVGVVHAAEQVTAENALHEIGRDAESVRKKILGSRANEVCHWRFGLQGRREGQS